MYIPPASEYGCAVILRIPPASEETRLGSGPTDGRPLPCSEKAAAGLTLFDLG